MKYDSKKDTLEHREMVAHYMMLIIRDLMSRIEEHDKSKMELGEVEIFDEFTPKLKDSTYGSPEYQQFLKEMKPALDHHYARYRHHPEYEDFNLLRWKSIAGYEKVYQISNYGDIKNISTGKILKANITPKGYLRIQLQTDGRSKNFMVHQLVAQAFIENPEVKPQVNHKDCNKKNNFVGNLEWSTNSENQLHAYENELQSVKYVVHCEELDITTFGCTAMERELKSRGYKNARESSILACLNETINTHMDMHFTGSLLAEYQRSKLSNMNLVDLVEMLCDWKASSMRHQDGNIVKSLSINEERFGYGKEFHHILLNTVKDYFDPREKP